MVEQVKRARPAGPAAERFADWDREMEHFAEQVAAKSTPAAAAAPNTRADQHDGRLLMPKPKLPSTGAPRAAAARKRSWTWPRTSSASWRRWTSSSGRWPWTSRSKDIEAMPDKSIVATLLNGAIRTSEQEEMAHLLRRKSQFIIAYGACAHLGGIPGLANQFSREQILRSSMKTTPTVVNEAEDPAAVDVQRQRPRRSRCRSFAMSCARSTRWWRWTITSPAARRRRRSPRRPWRAARRQAAAQGQRARAGHRAVRRVPAQGHQAHERQLHGIQASAPDADRPGALLPRPGHRVHGAGHARRLRGGLHRAATCPAPAASGPTSRVRDQGAEDPVVALRQCRRRKTRQEINSVLAGIPDPVGTFYRYGLAKSLLRRKVDLPDPT